MSQFFLFYFLHFLLIIFLGFPFFLLILLFYSSLLFTFSIWALMNIDAKIFKKLENWIYQYTNIEYHIWVRYIIHIQGWFNIWKSINLIYHIYLQNKEQKSYGYSNRCGKNIWQMQTSILGKHSQHTRNRMEIPQVDGKFTKNVHLIACLMVSLNALRAV